MGSKPHPLDVFRANESGFEQATRKRRRVDGKVVRSSVRRRPSRAGEPEAGATARARGPREAPGRPKARSTTRATSPATRGLVPPVGPRTGWSDRARGVTRSLLVGSVLVVAAVVLVVVLQQAGGTELFGSSTAGLPLKSKEEVLGPGERPATEAEATWFTIRAGSYNGSERGLELAYAAQAELTRRGFPEATVIGYPDPEEEGAFRSFELIVGRGAEREGLETLLRRLQAVDDWSADDPAPFVTAHVVRHPDPGAGG